MIRPIGGRILVQRIEAEETRGRIIIPETVKEKPQQGEVMAVARIPKKDEPIEVERGDRILFGKYAGTEVEIEGKQYLILDQRDIIGVIGEQDTQGGEI